MFHCDIYFFHQEYCANTMIGNTFRMPLYYFLSGLFFKTYRGFFDFVLKKINKLLIPFAFFIYLPEFCCRFYYKSMLTNTRNELAKSKQFVFILKEQIDEENANLQEKLDK